MKQITTRRFIYSLLEKSPGWNDKFYLERIDNNTYKFYAWTDFYRYYLFVFVTLKQYFNVNFYSNAHNVFLIEKKNNRKECVT